MVCPRGYKFPSWHKASEFWLSSEDRVVYYHVAVKKCVIDVRSETYRPPVRARRVGTWIIAMLPSATEEAYD